MSPILFLGSQDSSTSLPLPAACAEEPVNASSDRALVTAALVAEGKRAGKRYPVPCRL